MTRLACLLVLVALVVVAMLAVNPSGQTAIAFTFVGMPLLLLGMAIYGIQRWREGAFSNNHRAGKETS